MFRAPGIVEEPMQRQPVVVSKPLVGPWLLNVVGEDHLHDQSLYRIFQFQIFGQESKRLVPLAGDLMRRN